MSGRLRIGNCGSRQVTVIFREWWALPNKLGENVARPTNPSLAILSEFAKKREFLKRHSNSILPFALPRIRTVVTDRELVEHLAADVSSGNYFPKPPRGFISIHKANGVPRFLPSFSSEDAVVYFSCVMAMNDIIGIGRTRNTFGGWTMGNSARAEEQVETEKVDEEMLASFSPYPNDASMNPVLFRQIWRDFQRRAYQQSRSEDLTCFASIDIANFYDSINLNLLETSMRSILPSAFARILDLLFVFLRHWNRGIDGYSAKGTGLPLDEVGDSSRIISNLYLQSYDAAMASYCDKIGGLRYLRFADDQILMARSMDDLLMFIRLAGEQLHRIGLNINSSKVRIFEGQEGFDEHWCFDMFRMLVMDPNGLATSYFVRLNGNEFAPNSRYLSVLRALAWRPEQLSVKNQRQLIGATLAREQIENMPVPQLVRLSRFFSDSDWSTFSDIAEEIFCDLRFNEAPLKLYKLFMESPRSQVPKFAADYMTERRYEFKWLEISN